MWSEIIPEEQPRLPGKMQREITIDRMKKRYGLALIGMFIWAASMMLGCCITGWVVHNRTEKEVTERVTHEMRAAFQTYLNDQAYQRQAESFLSGEASREAFINQEIDAVAPVIAKLSTDAQKATEASCMLARVMSPNYPNSFQAVAAQPKQWMFYDGSDNTFSQHDREIAESIVRPYLENGIIPNGLTAELVYGSWSANDFILRDHYEGSGTMNTWRYGG